MIEKIPPNEIYKLVSEKARKENKKKSVDMNVEVEKLSEESRRMVAYNRELHEAMEMAAHFENNRHGKTGYVLTEGWDLHDIIHSLVVLSRVFKADVGRGKIVLSPDNSSGPT